MLSQLPCILFIKYRAVTWIFNLSWGGLKDIDALDENVQIMKCILCFNNISCFFFFNSVQYKEL